MTTGNTDTTLALNTLLALIKGLDKKVDLLMQQNARLTAIVENSVTKRLTSRTQSSKRGLSKSEATAQLQLQPTPSVGFFEWVHSVQQGLGAPFLERMRACDRFETLVLALLQERYVKSGSPIFAIKREKSNFIYEGSAFRLMNDNDMKRVLLAFQCRATLLLDEWNDSLTNGGDEDASERSENSTEEMQRHFHEKQFAAETDKVNRLLTGDAKALRTLLRKLNTAMLAARGIVFEGR